MVFCMACMGVSSAVSVIAVAANMFANALCELFLLVLMFICVCKAVSRPLAQPGVAQSGLEIADRWLSHRSCGPCRSF